MALKERVKRLEDKANPAEEIKISAKVWDEDKEPWPETEEAKKAYEAKIGVKVIWIEADPKPGQKAGCPCPKTRPKGKSSNEEKT